MLSSNMYHKSCSLLKAPLWPKQDMRGMEMKLIFPALTIFAALAQLKSSKGLNLEVSINTANDGAADMGPELFPGNTTYSRSSLGDFTTGQANISK